MADEPTTVDPGTETPTPVAETPPAGTETPTEGGEKPVSISAHEYGILRDARAREKALAEENERLKREAESRATTTTDTTREDDFQMTDAERKAYRAELKAAAKAGNRDAAALLVGIEAADEARIERRNMRFEMELRDIPEAKRDEVKKYMQETGAPTPAIAYKLMRGGEAATLEAEVLRLKQENEALKKGKPRVEGTRIAGLPGASDDDGTPAISLDEYNARMRKDPNKTIAERRAGKFRIKDA